MTKILILLLLSGSMGCFAQKVALALNLQQDSTYNLTTNANLTIIQTINGQQQVIGTLFGGKVSHKIIAIKDSLYEMDVQYKSLSMHMDIMGKTVDFNSELTDTQGPVGRILNAMLNNSFTMIVSNTGRVVEVKNIENLYNHMFDSFPEATEAQKAQFRTQMEQAFGEKAIKNNFQEAFAMFPKAKVGVNDKWFSINTLETVISAKIKTTYVLKAITDNAYLVRGDATILSTPAGAYKLSNGIPMRFINMAGTTTVELKLDKATGWVMEAKSNKIIKGTVQVQDTPKTPGGMTFPMSVTADMTVTGKL